MLVFFFLFLAVNYIADAARKTLGGYQPEGALGDTLSSIGIAHYLQICSNWWKTYDFFKSSGLPTELESRGFDDDFDMPCYLFRKDGLRLWEAYGEFASDFVDGIFDTDADVAKDEVVQEWAVETVASDKADVPGFPAVINDKATLVKIMQTIMWTTSGQHAAVNFPQYDYYGFVPNKPMHLRESSSDDMYGELLPDEGLMKQTLSTANILTLPSYTCVDNLEKQFNDVGKKAYEKFQSKLDVIGHDIEDRNYKNKLAKKPTYSYLHPSAVPASIDI
jgi:hypothetical protein